MANPVCSAEGRLGRNGCLTQQIPELQLGRRILRQAVPKLANWCPLSNQKCSVAGSPCTRSRENDAAGAFHQRREVSELAWAPNGTSHQDTTGRMPSALRDHGAVLGGKELSARLHDSFEPNGPPVTSRLKPWSGWFIKI